MVDQPFRWSSEIERQFLTLMAVGCAPSIVAEQIGCSERMARRLVARWKAGQSLHSAPRRSPRKLRLVPGKAPPGRPTGVMAARIAAMPEHERAALRRRALRRHVDGWSTERVAAAVRAPHVIVAAWIAEWDGSPIVEPEYPPGPPPVPVAPEWPSLVRFDDCPIAVRANLAGERIVGLSHVGRYTRGCSDTRSHVGCSAAMAVLG